MNRTLIAEIVRNGDDYKTSIVQNQLEPHKVTLRSESIKLTAPSYDESTRIVNDCLGHQGELMILQSKQHYAYHANLSFQNIFVIARVIVQL